MSSLPKITYRFDIMSIKILADIFKKKLYVSPNAKDLEQPKSSTDKEEQS